MPLKRQHFWIVTVASMEQIIGGALATVIGVMLPMLQLTLHPELPSFAQGIIGAMGLIGIGCGSFILGTVSDKSGYLFTFRLCPIIIMAGSLLCYFFPNVACLVVGMFICGVGVGGGYSLDSSYISELLPDKWKLTMVGIAKATCSIGFVGAAVVCLIMLKHQPNPHTWNSMALVIFAMGLITLLLRIRWWESPKWLIAHGKYKEAEIDTQKFLGKDVKIDDTPPSTVSSTPQSKFIIKNNIRQIIFSGIPWACEGLAVYGFSVFLPILVMALGIDHTGATGIAKIINSVETTAVVNFFMLPGFIIGLFMLRKVNNVKMLYIGFIFSAVGLLLLLIAYHFKWPAAAMLAGFVIFEIALNAGPHLITYIIPSRIYPVSVRAEGSGIAALMGKVGAVLGVILMPILLDIGGVNLVLIVSSGVMILGALIGMIYGKSLKLL